MKRFYEIVKECDIPEMLLYLICDIPLEDIERYLKIYYTIYQLFLIGKVKCDGRALAKLEVSEKNQKYCAKVYSIKCNDEKGIFYSGEAALVETEIKVENVDAINGFYIPDVFFDKVGQLFTVSVFFKEIAGEVKKLGNLVENREIFDEVKQKYLCKGEWKQQEIKLDYKLAAIYGRYEFLIEEIKAKYLCEIKGDECVKTWGEILFSDCNFGVECGLIYPNNPPVPGRCVKLKEEMIKAYFKKPHLKEITEKIVISKEEMDIHTLPLVWVVDASGEKSELSEFILEEIVRMPIEVHAGQYENVNKLMVLFALYYLYPLRMKRQKQRDEVKNLINILGNYKSWREYGK